MYGQATVEAHGGASGGFAAKKSARWAGRVVSALVAAFLLFDAGIKVMMPWRVRCSSATRRGPSSG